MQNNNLLAVTSAIKNIKDQGHRACFSDIRITDVRNGGVIIWGLCESVLNLLRDTSDDFENLVDIPLDEQNPQLLTFDVKAFGRKMVEVSIERPWYYEVNILDTKKPT